jgi:hypothetical protein
LKHFGPKVLLTALLGFLLLASSSSLALTTSPHNSHIELPPPPSDEFQLRDRSLPVTTDPLWDEGRWGGPPQKHPVAVPEGGSEATYLGLTGLMCFFAIGLSRKWKLQ